MYYNLNTETMDYIVLNKKSNNFSYQLLISNKNKGSGGSVVAQQKCYAKYLLKGNYKNKFDLYVIHLMLALG